MVKAVKILWISAVVLNLASIVFFFMLTNHWLTQGWIMDIISTVVLQIVGVPSAALIVVSLCIFKFNWKPASWVGYLGALIIIAALLWIAGYLFLFAWLSI
ncbi:hypothetical protein GC101_17575 [Paenibacillus sp. LMG 31459]|uniref:Uncharacterized protein n=1 Tax=Paenibacillus phytohabitans TaxID=2654978 RepID=A0ABX1YKN1_9BACL|nr:hypothetical protein [Paenibacillus phytohabitans]NOU80676.1 hypothetical protein [Paenibacillus phytohabitans]